ncbi:MAG: DUF6029 family protein [Bacteroidaceae bacterium]|nr:DUF6029 family protein [Bacteroidaceae bacterium]
MRKTLTGLLLVGTLGIQAQSDNGVTLSGSVQSDMMIAPQDDEAIGTGEYDNKNFLTNTYVDLLLQSKRIDAGVRAEFTEFPMPGFQDAYNNFKGWGVPNAWVKYKGDKFDVTAGSFYEQFGSGFILRTYEERSLGIDNSLLGARVTVQPAKGVQLKALSGLQRTYWKWDKNTLVSGADMEVSLDEWIKPMQENGTRVSLGASWVNKRETNDDIVMADATHRLNFPEYVNAFDVRAKLQKGGFSVLGEYAQKTGDPNKLNNFTYGKGNVAMLSMSYAKSGLSVLAQAKRSENMGFRSSRTLSPLSKAGYINHLPAFTLDQTYSLAALYPYATQTEGEWAFQGGLGYNFKRKTTFGGKYGTKVKVNYSLVKGLEHNNSKGNPGTDGIENAFFKMGDVYYQDFDVNLEKRLTKSFDIHLMYMYQQYNKGIIQQEGGNIYSNIFIGEGKYKINKKLTLRGEAQYLLTDHESGDWGFGLLELSVAPHLMFTVSDQIGKTEPSPGVYGDVAHYYNFAVTTNIKSHRIMLSYGRTRAGYNCTGGVCRYVPANKGLVINYNYNF